MAPGRNDPCPCGSGKKYKRCCLGEAAGELPAEARAMRRMQSPLEETLWRYAHDSFGRDAAEIAASAFANSVETRGTHPEDSDPALFIPWFLYTWTPAPIPDADEARQEQNPVVDSIAARFLAERRKTLDPDGVRFIEATVRSPFSFHDVISTDPGRSVRLRDIFLGREVEVFEESGSRVLERGDILYGRVVGVGDMHLLVGSGSLRIPPIEKGAILGFREKIRTALGAITPALLHVGEPHLRALYFVIADRLLHPPTPILQNTDGDPLLLHTIRYTIESAEETFQALKPLALATEDEELLVDARRDDTGHLVAVSFPWLKRGNKKHRSWENTVLGDIAIDGRALKISVNSAKRAKRIRQEVEKRLADRARHLATTIQPAESALSEAEKGGDGAMLRSDDGLSEFERSPEGIAVFREVMGRHWDAWPDEPVPALGGKTPRQAVKDPVGREMVEALLLQFERAEARRPEPLRCDIDRLRESLGLKRSASRKAN